MILYLIAVTINLAAILSVITNFNYEVFNLENPRGGYDAVNLSGFVLAGVMAFSFYLVHINYLLIATILAWMSAIPLLFYGMLVVLMVTLKPDWK